MSGGSAHLVMGSAGGFCLLTAGLDPTELFYVGKMQQTQRLLLSNTHGDGVGGSRLAP